MKRWYQISFFGLKAFSQSEGLKRKQTNISTLCGVFNMTQKPPRQIRGEGDLIKEILAE